VEAGEGFALVQGGAYSAGSSPGANEVTVAAGAQTFSGGFQLSADANWSALVATFVARSLRPQLGLRFAGVPGVAVRPPMLY
jgi:hypothetical protein